jgi:hypothetical protein
VAVAAAVVAYLVELPSAIDDAHSAASALPPEQRLISPAYAIDISRDFVLAAKDLIPPGDTYAVEVGSHVPVSTPVTLTGLPAYIGYWLLPRRLVATTDSPRWLLCYGCDLAAWQAKGPVQIGWQDGQGIEIARIGP